MKTYQKALALLNGRQSKKIAGNTIARLETDKSVRVCFYNTDIVSVFPDGEIRISSGGYQTVTTKTRINWLLGELGSQWSIHQKSRVWLWSKYLGNGKHSKPRPFLGWNAFNASGALISK